jgi:hypothetical protein
MAGRSASAGVFYLFAHGLSPEYSAKVPENRTWMPECPGTRIPEEMPRRVWRWKFWVLFRLLSPGF